MSYQTTLVIMYKRVISVLANASKRRLVAIEDDNLNWASSGFHCLNKDMYPSAIIYEERNEYERGSLKVPSPSWTALFRDQCVYVPGQGMW